MVKIVTDSVAALPVGAASERDIEVVSLFVNYNGNEYDDAAMDVDAFYRDIYDMIDNPPTSSQPSQLALESAFERAAQAGQEVLGVFISSKLSGTFDGAVRAARAVKSRYLDFRCTLIDSASTGFDEGCLVLDAADARDCGGDLAACARAVQEGILNSRFLFVPESLSFLRAGGRIGGAAALLGNLVKISPILTVRDGAATTFAKVRTQKKAIDRMAQEFKNDVSAHGLLRVVVHYIGDSELARVWARETVEPIAGCAVDVLPVSPVIGTHVGPAIGIAYECRERIEGKLTCNPDELSISIA